MRDRIVLKGFCRDILKIQIAKSFLALEFAFVGKRGYATRLFASTKGGG
jgi:hypothetical protein